VLKQTTTVLRLPGTNFAVAQTLLDTKSPKISIVHYYGVGSVITKQTQKHLT
jgi:hypothetical protein